ncbi:MAG TPA: hypothetical protein VL242_24860 [Sorangium sp.]|nr:hypothetical protein [Sorangium sp.]
MRSHSQSCRITKPSSSAPATWTIPRRGGVDASMSARTRSI